MSLVYCYNPGCQQKFDPEKNSKDSCVYHPGPHFFHDAYKGWECCQKRVTDFTEFLNIKGCARGFHNPNKPPEPEKPKKLENDAEIFIQEAPKPSKPPVSAERPSQEENLVPIKLTVSPQLTAALEKKAQEKKDLMAENSVPDSKNGTPSIAPGTSCQNSGCKSTFIDESSLEENCLFHPGVPIFHEGMKYWSCCRKKTTEFDNFLDQAGCQTGKHAWTKEAAGKSQTDCKTDYHQTGSHVVLVVYAKGTVPDLSRFEANRVNLRAHVEFDFGASQFDLNIPLWGAISTENTTVSVTPNKIEIKMKKADPFRWPRLEYTA